MYYNKPEEDREVEYLFWQNRAGTVYGVSQGGPGADGAIEILSQDGTRITVNVQDGWHTITPEAILRELGKMRQFILEKIGPETPLYG